MSYRTNARLHRWHPANLYRNLQLTNKVEHHLISFSKRYDTVDRKVRAFIVAVNCFWSPAIYWVSRDIEWVGGIERARGVGMAKHAPIPQTSPHIAYKQTHPHPQHKSANRPNWQWTIEWQFAGGIKSDQIKYTTFYFARDTFEIVRCGVVRVGVCVFLCLCE